jgi:4-hydroxythreonine-4-phosphate dehydrogenase
VIQLAHGAISRLVDHEPVIGVAGLNPHCGEARMFGTEDEDEILPAVKAAQDAGINVQGPIPADTIFSKMKGGSYDGVVVMYHDQGHIPTKLQGFQMNNETGEWENLSGVNVTLGLPIIRVSVDHGTAFDIADRGVANPQSMSDAIRMAALLAGKK